MNTLSKDVILKLKSNINNNNKNDIKKYGVKGTLTYEDFISKIEGQSNKCYVCLQEFRYDGGKYCLFFPSADRIYNYSRHTKENVAVSCLFCNIRMFKDNVSQQKGEKKCGLCDGLNHMYEGDIITKSSLFNSLGNNNYRIKEYINALTKTLAPASPNRSRSLTHSPETTGQTGDPSRPSATPKPDPDSQRPQASLDK